LVVSGRVDQLGMIATLASSRSRVQIPSRPPYEFRRYLTYFSNNLDAEIDDLKAFFLETVILKHSRSRRLA
jgi:hypothetical protein